MNLKVDIIESEEGPGYGAAILAAVGCGEYASVEEAAEKLVKVIDTIEPEPELGRNTRQNIRSLKRSIPTVKNCTAGKNKEPGRLKSGFRRPGTFLDKDLKEDYNIYRTLTYRIQDNRITRGGAVWKLVGLITRRPQVQILPPQSYKGISFLICLYLLRRKTRG